MGESPEGPSAWDDDDADDPEALAALAGLAPERRAVVVLRHLLDYTPPEIATMLDLPVGTVNSRLGRAPRRAARAAGGGGMTDVERRLRRTLDGLPEPSPQARARAERAALEALPRAGRGRPRWLLPAAAAIGAVAVAGVALAATDRLDVRLGQPAAQERPAPPASEAVRVPEGAAGLALVADGRLWLGTRSGLGVQRLAVTTAELSPNALYAAVGIGRALVAIAPDGRRAWSHPTAGPVVAASWAPNPIVVAYVVRRGARHELRVIEGDGDHDRLVDPRVAPGRPSWRADSHALAYVAAGGEARVAHYPSLAARTVAAPPAGVAAVAFAPAGARLALATAGPGVALAVEEGAGVAGWLPLGEPRAQVTALTWGSDRELLAAGADPREGAPDWIWSLVGRAGALGKPDGAANAPGPAVGLAPIGDGGRLAVAVPIGEELQVWETDAPRRGDAELRPRRILLRVPSAGAAGTLSIR